MRSTIFFSLAAVAVAQMDNDMDSSVPAYSNPNTMYLTQTDSRGVVTGQPTDIPAVVTDQPSVATSPAGSNLPESSMMMSGSMYGNSRSTGPMMMSGAPAMPTGSAMSGMSSMMGGAMGTQSMMMGGATPTASGGMGSSSSGSDSDSDSSSGTSSSSDSSETGAAPALQVGTGLLGVVGIVFAAFL